MKLVAVDIGGTHARFALAEVESGRVVSLGPATTLRTAEHASFQLAWQAFAATQNEPLPRAAAIAIAAPITGEVIKLTNNPWLIRPALIGEKLGVDAHVLVNDFEAVGHAVGQGDPAAFAHLAGPDEPLPATGTISVVGPGTGLGVAQVVRSGDAYRVQATEGGHVGFAPMDAVEDAILARLRARLCRVSVERVVSGPALVDIYETLAALGHTAVTPVDDKALWTLALAGEDALAVAALDRFILALGAAAGDMALAHGAGAVVIAGGLGARLADHLAAPAFHERFCAKGRFEGLMRALPIKRMTLAEPGLFGAAAAFAQLLG